MIEGKFIPGGTTVVGLLLPAMRSAQHWGDDPEMFRPERFLDVDDKTRAARERLVELGFAYGRFRCAGQPVAFAELNKVFFEVCCISGPGVRRKQESGFSRALTPAPAPGGQTPQLFRHFDFQLANPAKPWDEEYYTIWRDENFRVLVSQADDMT